MEYHTTLLILQLDIFPKSKYGPCDIHEWYTIDNNYNNKNFLET